VLLVGCGALELCDPDHLGIAQSVLSRWVARARREAEPGALTAAERDELKRLRRENDILRQERDILKKAAAFFAKEM
jgi:transposase